MSKPSVPTENMPAVEDFLEARARIVAFEKRNAALMAELSALVEEYNSALENAEKAVRAKGVSCGPFLLSEGVATVDVEGLYDSLGEEWFRSVGGIVETRPALSVDKKRVMAYAESGTIPKEVVDKYIKVTPRLSKPSKVSLP